MKIKEYDENFIVEEIITLPKLEDNYNDHFCYAYYLMKKKNFNTMSAILVVAREFNTSIKFMCFCGNKDKNAITKQVISVKSNKRILDRLKKEVNIGHEKSYIKLTRLGFNSKPVYLGMHSGNKFTIKITETSEEELKIFNLKLKSLKHEKFQFVNYFGEQRFSSHNSEIGKLLIKKDFKSAFELILKTDKEFRKRIERKINASKNDYVNALKIIPLKQLTLYINAYQSLLWNKIAEYADSILLKKFNPEIPLIGFDTNLNENLQKLNDELNNESTSNTKKKKLTFEQGLIETYIKLINDEKIIAKDFVIKQIPQISVQGWARNLYEKINDFNIIDIEKINDSYNITISFSLTKSCYATTVIKEIFKKQTTASS